MHMLAGNCVLVVVLGPANHRAGDFRRASKHVPSAAVVGRTVALYIHTTCKIQGARWPWFDQVLSSSLSPVQVSESESELSERGEQHVSVTFSLSSARHG
jgi:hypothetical protein